MPVASKRKRKRCQAVTLGICPLPSMSAFLLARLAMSLTLPARSTHTLNDRLENLSGEKKVKQNSKAILCG